MRTRSLSRQLLTVSIWIIILTALLGAVFIFYMRRNIANEVAYNNRNMIKTITNQLEEGVERPVQMLMEIDGIVSEAGVLESPAVTAYMSSVMEVYKHFQTVYLVDEDGWILNSAPYDQGAMHQNIKDKPYFRNGRLNEVYWSDVYVSAATGGPTISAVIIKEGYMIVAELNLDRMSSEYKDEHYFDDITEIAILDRKGFYAMTEDMRKVYLGEVHPLFDPETPEREVSEGSESIVFRKIDAFDWHVVYTFDRSQVYGDLNRVTLVAALVWTGLTLMLLYFILNYFRSVNRSFEELKKRSERVTEGKYNLTPYTFVFDEFIGLARNFDLMTQEIQRREAEVNSFNEALSKQVKKRTHELAVATIKLQDEVEEKAKAQAQILEINESLDERVRMKTFELEHVNRQLVENIRAVEEANNAKSHFLAVMSHEMRTPLNAIIGFMQMVDRSAVGEENQELLEMVDTSSKVLLALINNLLDVSKYEAEKVSFTEEIFDGYTTFYEAIMPYRATAVSKGLSFAFEIEGLRDVWFKADELKMVQLLNNLLNNAVKFTEEGHIRTTVDCVRKDERWHLTLTVEDSGIGIKKEMRSLLFTPFSQGDETISRDYGGTGLGLAIARRIVEHYDGSIDYTSSYGEGTVFVAEMYLAAVFGERQTIDEIDEAKRSVEGQRILLVEDNIVNQKLMHTFFKKNNRTFDLAVNGAEAVDAVRSIDYDLILMDCQMPVMDGLEATEIIRTFNNDVKIYAMTAFASAEDYRRCVDAGMDGHFAKPIDLNELGHLLGFKRYQKEVVTAGESEVPLTFDQVVTKLEAVTGFDSETCIELVGTYVEQMKMDFDELKALYEAWDAEGLRKKLHQLKGAAGAVSIEPHRKSFEQAETWVKEDELDEAMKEVDAIAKGPLFL